MSVVRSKPVYSALLRAVEKVELALRELKKAGRAAGAEWEREHQDLRDQVMARNTATVGVEDYSNEQAELLAELEQLDVGDPESNTGYELKAIQEAFLTQVADVIQESLEDRPELVRKLLAAPLPDADDD